MMGFQSDQQPKLFYPSINLEQRIPERHILRRIRNQVDFDFIYDEVRDRYGINGNVSVPPPALLKMMLLLVLYNVRSERELMNTIPLRLDWLWFLGYDLDSEVPNHSVLSKARMRWGVEAFRSFFERIVWQCVQAGLVDGAVNDRLKVYQFCRSKSVPPPARQSSQGGAVETASPPCLG